MANDIAIVMLAGRAFAGFKKLSVSQDFDAATGEAQITISPQPADERPGVRIGDAGIVILNGQPVVTGYVRSVNIRHSWTAHDIDIVLRDKTSDFVESTLPPGVEFKPPVSLKEIYDGTLKKMELSDIKVIDKANPEKFRQGGEVPIGMVGQRGHDFGDHWASKRQVVTHTDGKGNIVIDRNMMRMGPGHLHKGFQDDPLNNVLEAAYSATEENRQNSTEVAGQKSSNDLDYWEKRPKSDDPAQANPMATNWGKATDTAIRPQRKRHIRSGQGIEGKTPEDAAKWFSNLSRARGFTYTATVQGFGPAPGVLWWPGVMVPVFDYHCEIADVLFLKGVTFSKDWSSGTKTELRLTYGDAFSEQGGPSSAGNRTGKGGFAGPKAGTY